MMGHSLPLHILLTKSDKLSRNGVRQALAKTQSQFRGAEQSVSTLSVQTRQGLELLEQKCSEWLSVPDQCA